jgi:hypothetical protein
MCVHFQSIKFVVQAPLVEIGLTVWQKIGGRAKAWSAISYTLLISTFSLHSKKRDAANIILKHAFIFKMLGGDNFFNVFAGARITKPLFYSMNMLPNWSAFLSLDSTSYKWRCQLMYSMKIRVLIIL